MGDTQKSQDPRKIFLVGYRTIRFYADRDPSISPPTGLYLQHDGIYLQSFTFDFPLERNALIGKLWNSGNKQDKEVVKRMAECSEIDILNMFLCALHEPSLDKNYKKKIIRKVRNSYTFLSGCDILDGRSFND